jgi:hypothetical protein
LAFAAGTHSIRGDMQDSNLLHEILRRFRGFSRDTDEDLRTKVMDEKYPFHAARARTCNIS